MTTTASLSNKTTGKGIQGGGEMGELTRSFPWQNTTLGPIENWPLSLRTLVNMMLNSRFPMLMFWGKELITFYNDAFRPSLGNEGKHPSSLGQRGEESWVESWPVIGPMIYNIMAGGDAVLFEDQKLPIYREGKMGDAYWTYSFSPVMDDDGETNGILVTCTETTKAVEAIENLGRSEGQFKNLVRETSAGIAVLIGPQFRVEIANDAFALLLGRTVEELLGRNQFEVIPEAEAFFRPLMEKAMYQNEPTYLNNTPYMVLDKRGEKIEGVVNITYQPYKELDGEVTGLIVLCQDVAIQEKAQQQIRESGQRLLASFNDLMIGLAIIGGANLTFQMVNPFYCFLYGRTREELTGKPLLEAMPELAGAGFDILLQDVIATGIPYSAKEIPVQVQRSGYLDTIYIDHTYQPQYDEAGNVVSVLVLVIDVTRQVLSRLQIEDSEAKFRDLIEQAPVASCLFVGREMKIEVANNSMLSIWGKGATVLGQTLLEALPELEGQPFIQILDEVFTSGKAYAANGTRADLVVNGTLQTFYFDFTYKPVFNTKGQVYGVIDVAVDVTEQVLANEEIQQAEQNLRMAVDAAALATFSMDIKSRKLLASPRLKEYFGYGPEEEMPYEAAAAQIREDYRQSVLEEVEAAIIQKIPFDREYPVIGHNDGKTRWVRSVGTLQARNDGRTYYTGILNDITEKKLDEIRKNDFIGMVSHELKTPLTSMSGYLQFLQAKAVKNKDVFTTGILQKANKQIGKMTTMINGFLNVSRLESGKIHINKTRFDMAGLVKEAEEEIVASINSHQVIFAPVQPTFVLADRDKIGHVISNLISNALKYSPATSVVHVACITKDDTVELSVRDEGIGIKPEDVSKLFDRYYRVGGDSTVSGFGIGLYLCKEIIDRHQGTIRVESEPDRGSVFYFTLPVAD